VQQECLDYALADPDLMGVWGGMSQSDRSRQRTVTGVSAA
jgi:hypothetical protein